MSEPVSHRWIGIDHGSKRIGLAVGDAGGIVTPLAPIEAKPMENVIERVRQLLSEYDAGGIVVGLPLNMDGTEGQQGKLAREFAGKLARSLNVKVEMHDERLSTFQANQSLAGNFTRKKKKARRDSIAAATILKDFIESDEPNG